MKKLLVFSIPLVLPCCGWAADLKFSHRLHLETVGAQCADCHGSAAVSASAADRKLPAEKDCLKCHDGKRARKDCVVCHVDPKRASRVPVAKRNLRFNHKLHLALGNVAPLLAAAIDSKKYLGTPGDIRRELNTKNPCVACHRGLQRVDLASQMNLPQMADCLVCHSQIEPPFSCEKCHVDTRSLKPATHTRDFIDVHSSKKAQFDKTSCRVCHGVGFRCMGCH